MVRRPANKLSSLMGKLSERSNQSDDLLGNWLKYNLI